jgi:transcriptional regulator with GAF, ATPase, and Fis domain
MAESVNHTVVVPGGPGRAEHLQRAFYRLSSGRGRDQLSYRGCDDVVTIGTHPANQLVLPQATVSRFHARIELDAVGYRLVDLESTNGTFVGALRIGSAYVVPKVKLRFGDVEAVFELEREQAALELGAGDRWGAVVGRSPVMRRLFEQLDAVAASDSTVLIVGETGVGKDLLAEELHRHSPRRDRPFIVVDCGALPEALIDSELFGHERGAFTGADVARAGAFEAAHGGTIFLDEIGELALPLQAKLLRVLERREVKRLGANHPRPVDVRVLCATHRDLPRMCNQRLFREDLFYRLSVITMRVPPLRDRIEDLPLLATTFLQEAGASFTLDDGVLAALSGRRWPGNIRELRNLLQNAMALGPDALADESRAAPPLSAGEQPYKVAKAHAIEQFERGFLEALLARHKGNVASAAREAQVDAAWIFRLLKRYGIERKTPRR